MVYNWGYILFFTWVMLIGYSGIMSAQGSETNIHPTTHQIKIETTKMN